MDHSLADISISLVGFRRRTSTRLHDRPTLAFRPGHLMCRLVFFWVLFHRSSLETLGRAASVGSKSVACLYSLHGDRVDYQRLIVPLLSFVRT